MLKKYSTDWTGIRRTDPKATVIEWRPATPGARHIYVSKATIRLAVIEGGVFQLDDVVEPIRILRDKQRAVVRCLWNGRKPLMTWMHLTLLSGYEERKNYRGDVVTNIGRLP